MAPAGATLLTPKVFSLPFSRLKGLTLIVVAGIQESEQKCTRPLETQAQNWNYLAYDNMLMTKARHKSIAWSQGWETDSRSSWKELESHISKRVAERRVEIETVFAMNPLHRTATLVEMENWRGRVYLKAIFSQQAPCFYVHYIFIKGGVMLSPLSHTRY